MSSSEPASANAKSSPGSFTERAALQFLQRQPSIAPVAPADDPVHILNPDERAALRRIEHRTIARAALAGALSACASAVASVVANLSHPTDGANVSLHNLLNYWGWVGAVTLVASIVEIAFLYWDALRAVHQMACVAGLGLVPEDESQHDDELLLSLARAALELPSPPKPLAEIDPRRESSRWLIIGASLIYKTKIALTTFLTKAILRSALGRAAARAVLDFVAVPVTAAWNAIICYFVLREARLRILGPSAIVELVQVATQTRNISDRGWSVAQRAVASAVVRTREFHPNHLKMVQTLNHRCPLSEVPEADDTQRFIRELARLDPPDQVLVLHVLVTAAILDGRLTRPEKRLVEQAFATCGRPIDLRQIGIIVRAFRAGQPVTDLIQAALPAVGELGVPLPDLSRR